MKTIDQQLISYASYHRNFKNILTHFVGVPLIYLSVVSLLSRPVISLASDAVTLSFTPAYILAAILCFYYLRLHRGLGILMLLFNAGCFAIAGLFAAYSTSLWLTVSIGLFVVGWIIQFIGHYFEGKKPAFVDDIMGLAIGPLFVVAEWAFMLGAFKSLNAKIEAHFTALQTSPSED
ncbi:DUF962 domain-containing protein [Umboniibacter marinipuniceus]|uniref:Putative membrane protein YGL010W n=1 Tax=Umboniibacter marinipuniceus TaxID=569599 RepID=A0A3M0A5Y8_9GAMM|nr:Mpo1-like protein [Umboniibacter marinipuniceus]RMA78929.1 putative membrane protein YGL010W [Umboniibacter marinipuniceus]